MRESGGMLISRSKNDMNRGFTLLEIIIVIVIIGVLAALGFMQYGRVIDRSRGAEARAICGDIRKFASAYRMQHGTVAAMAPADVNIGPNADDLPGPTAGDCRQTHYFWYDIAAADPQVTITATRCTAGGKTPDGAAARTLVLTVDFSNGVDTISGEY
jgi:prepilin-type N-terminal cleavage/methylation domain-containing protein